MFCVLSVKRRDNTVFERLFGRLIKDDYSLKTVPVLKGAPFYLLTATVGKRGADFEMISEIAGKCAKKLLTDETLPENGSLGIFKSQMLINKAYENTFLRILKNNPKKTVCIVNCNTEFLRKASFYALRLTVVTNKKERYEKVSEKILEDTGISVSLLSAPDNSEIQIDLNDFTMTVNKSLTMKNGSSLSVPEIYKNLKPENVNGYDFYSALYELCGVFSLGESIFEYIEVNCEKRCADSIHFT